MLLLKLTQLMRILEIVKADHDNFRRTLARIEATTEKDIEQRKQLLPQHEIAPCSPFG
jgi:hypothetical protein